MCTEEIRRAGRFAIDGTIIVDMPQLPEGKAFRPTEIQFLEDTREIPATLGTGFGLEYVVSSNPPHHFTRLKVVMTHPPITNPTTGLTFSHSAYTASVPNNRVQRFLYRFDKTWEAVPGDWMIYILHEGRLLLSQEFKVVAP